MIKAPPPHRVANLEDPTPTRATCAVGPWPPAKTIAESVGIQPLKDSGERRETGFGAVRDRSAGKGRFDLLQVHGVLLAAQQLEQGALKYNDRNWEKGMPLSWFADSAMRHLLKVIAGYDDEPHVSAAIWNLLCLAEGQQRIKQGIWPAELDDLPKTYAGKTPPF